MNSAPLRLSVASEHGLSLDGFVHQTLPAYTPTFSVRSIFDWPSAYERPMFYVAVYALIGVVNAIVSVTAAGVQYTGALRASRILFK